MRTPLLLVAMWMMIAAHAPAAAQAAPDEPALVFLLGGQSNMEGVGSVNGLPAPYDDPLPAVQIWRHSSASYTDLAPGFGNGGVADGGANKFGPELVFGHTMAGLYEGQDIYLIKYAVSGTDLANDWDPDGNNNPQYDTFNQRVSAALADLDTAGVEYEIAGMLWMQGERDARSDTAGPAYGDNLADFVEDMRDHYGDDLHFVLGRLHDQLPAVYTHAHDVRDGQAATADADLRVAYVDTDDFQLNGDSIHFGQAGQLSLGAGFAEQMHALMTMHANADVNQDGFVGVEDLDILLAHWGNNTATLAQGDLNGDGTVDGTDLAVVIDNWGHGTPPDTAVPEPASALSLGGVLLMCLRRGVR